MTNGIAAALAAPGISRVSLLVQKHYCDCVSSPLLSSRISGDIDGTIEAVCCLITFSLGTDGFSACFGPGLSGREI
jgi:hypothetical protein